SPAAIIPDGLDAAILLVRHGESALIAERRFQGQLETPLSRIGLRQAELTARRLARPHDAPALPVPTGNPREIAHSPLRRSAETADAIARAMITGGLAAGAVRPESGFMEIGQGAWEGLQASEVSTRFGAELAAWRRRPTEAWAPGGESLPVVADRVRPALARV